MATLSLTQTEVGLAPALAGRTVLMLPGWNGSGPDHWQTIWENKYPTLQRVEQRDWSNPCPIAWADEISERGMGGGEPSGAGRA